ncbi:MAG: hypothetical protein IT328_11030 [Caldilineaceae bacterium]|nr:hypothetical protein [Caldilineaceae bacterium]
MHEKSALKPQCLSGEYGPALERQLEQEILNLALPFPKGIEFDTLLNALQQKKSKHGTDKVRVAIWRLIDRGILELTVERRLRVTGLHDINEYMPYLRQVES